MGLRIQNAGTLRTIAALTIKHAGFERTIKTLKVMDGGTLRTVAVFAGPLSVTATDPVRGNARAGATADVTTALATASVTGGLPPYTYAWTPVTNGGGNASAANNPTLASTTFTKTSVPVDGYYADTWRVTVTDSVGATVTDTISAIFQNATTGGGTE